MKYYCEEGKCNHETFSCTLCKWKFKDHAILLKHRKEKHPSSKICRQGSACQDNDCRFQHENDMEIETIRETPRTSEEAPHKCNTCDMPFTTKKELTTHITQSHKNFKPCRSFATSTCEYDEDCWFNHIILADNEHICFKCGKVENSKTDLMKHIKTIHKGIPCLNFKSGTCRFSSSSCIFSHELPQAHQANGSQTSREPQANARPSPQNREQDFPQAWQAKPPDQAQVISQIVTEVMNKLLPMVKEQVNQQLMNRQTEAI